MHRGIVSFRGIARNLSSRTDRFLVLTQWTAQGLHRVCFEICVLAAVGSRQCSSFAFLDTSDVLLPSDRVCFSRAAIREYFFNRSTRARIRQAAVNQRRNVREYARESFSPSFHVRKMLMGISKGTKLRAVAHLFERLGAYDLTQVLARCTASPLSQGPLG